MKGLLASPVQFSCLRGTHQEAHSHMTGVLICLEEMASENYNLLAEILPSCQDDFLRLSIIRQDRGHSIEYCAKRILTEPNIKLSERLLLPLRNFFKDAYMKRDLSRCLIIQHLMTECFMLSTYLLYLPLLDEYTTFIVRKALSDEIDEPLYSQNQLKRHLKEVAKDIETSMKLALHEIILVTKALNSNMDLTGIDTYKLSMEIFISSKEFLEEIGFSSIEARKIVRSIWQKEMVVYWKTKRYD